MENQFVRFEQSRIHGTGGYAKCDIPSGTTLIEYLGEKIDKAEAARRCEDGNYFTDRRVVSYQELEGEFYAVEAFVTTLDISKMSASD